MKWRSERPLRIEAAPVYAVAITRVETTMLLAGRARYCYLFQAWSIIPARTGANRIPVAIDRIQCLLPSRAGMRAHTNHKPS